MRCGGAEKLGEVRQTLREIAHHLHPRERLRMSISGSRDFHCQHLSTAGIGQFLRLIDFLEVNCKMLRKSQINLLKAQQTDFNCQQTIFVKYIFLEVPRKLV